VAGAPIEQWGVVKRHTDIAAHELLFDSSPGLTSLDRGMEMSVMVLRLVFIGPFEGGVARGREY